MTLHDFLLFVTSELKLELAPDTLSQKTLAELEIDSLDLTQLVIELEDQHQLTFDIDTLKSDVTVESLFSSLIQVST